MQYNILLDKVRDTFKDNVIIQEISLELKKYTGNEYSDNIFLEKLTELLYWLYIYDNSDMCTAFKPIIDNVKLTSNKDIWVWVECSLVLFSRIFKEKNNNTEAVECLNKIQEAFKIGSEMAIKINAKVRGRKLEGEGLFYTDIEAANKEGDKKLEMSYRLIHLIRLCYIKELGGSSKFSIDKAESEIQDTISAIKRLNS